MTDIDLARVKQRWDAADKSGVSPSIVTGLEDFLFRHLEPGGFLKAALCNDLFQTISYADPESMAALRNITSLVYDCIPYELCSDRQAVDDWIAAREEAA